MNKTRTDILIKILFLQGLIVFFSLARGFAQAPVIGSFSPASGPVGATVTILGSGFVPYTLQNDGPEAKDIVFFGATQAKVVLATTVSLVVTVPVSATYVPISVLNGKTGLTGYSQQPFVTTFNPNKGSITASDFSPPVHFNTGTEGDCVSVFDLDGDGKPDVVLLNSYANTISVLRNTSVSGSITTNSFAFKVDFATGNSPLSLVVSDFDGDGKPDLAFINTRDSTLSVLRNTSTIGSISFAAAVTVKAGPNFGILTGPSFGLAAGDMDGDGKPDLVATNSVYTMPNNTNTYTNTTFVLRNTSTIGSISFAPGVAVYAAHGTDAEDLTIGDIDGDGKPDIVASLFILGEVVILRNTSTAGSIDSATSFAAPVYLTTRNSGAINFPFSVSIGDLDGDGKPDLVVANGDADNNNNLCILRNTSIAGSISFATQVDLPFNYPNSSFSAITDLDGDGKPDIAIAATDLDSLVVFRNTSSIGSITTGSFASKVEFNTGYQPKYGNIAIADIDGDGKPDLLASNDNNNVGETLAILRNNPFFLPNVQATNVIFSNTGQNTTTASWTNGNGQDRAVFISAVSTGSPLPVNRTAYTANAAYGQGTQVGASGWYCIYNGTGNTVNITGLSSGATYRVMVVEYNGGTGPQDYLTTTATGNPANVTTLTGGAIAIDSINRVTSSPTNAAIIQYRVIFAATVKGLATSNFALATTGNVSGVSITSLSGTGTTYIVTVNAGTGDGSVGLNLANAAGLTPGIITPLPFVGAIYIIDRTPPSVTISPPSVSNIISGSGTVTYTVTYADVNFNSSTLTAANITLNSAGSATGTIGVTGSDTSYTVSISGITGSGPLGISIAAGTASDLAGNLAAAAGPSATFLISPIINNMTISSGTLSPAFTSQDTAYTATETNAISALTVTPTTNDPNATITVNGGSPATPVNLAVGFNTITVNITSTDGNTTTTYTIVVLRAAPVLTGKAPDITYGNGSATAANSVPFSVTPTNIGGPVPQTYYGQVTTFAGSTAATAGYINGTGTAAQFNVPQQMVSDAAGNLYVTDAANNAIRMITPAGVVTTFAGSTTGQSGFQNGQGAAALFNYPNGITIDASGNLFVADYYNNAIREISIAGQVSTFYTSTDTFFNPAGLCMDAAGNLVVSSQGFNQIVKISPAGIATIIAGINEGYLNGPAATAQFDNPTDVKTDTAGNFYVADYLNNAIRKISTAGVVSTYAGSAIAGNTPGYANGVGTAALFNGTVGLVVGPQSVMYVADIGNNDIRQIMPDGTVSLTAGSATQAAGNADGIGTAAGINQPDYLYIDGNGLGYFAEFAGNRVRKLVLTGYTLKGVLPAGFTFNPTTGIISGTATAPFTATTDTVTAYNAFGYSTTIIKIIYQPASAIATLTNLQLSSGILTPVFASGTTSYTDTVSNSITSITLTPTATDTTAKITVNGNAVTSGTASGAIPLAVGPNTITTVVTAQNGTTTDTYTVIVTRLPGSIATLNNLTVSQGALTPVFASRTTSYTDTVSNATSFITVTPTTTDSTATITVNGIAVPSGTASGAIPLALGSNTILTTVTAQDGATIDTYSVIVIRLLNSDATLLNLTVSTGTLTPTFASGTTSYTDTVSNATTSIALTPTTTNTNATVTVNGVAVASGTASGAIPLSIGPNTITTIVVAQDGATTDTYTVVVTRAPGTIATLNNLTVSQGTLTPAFATATIAYTDSVSNAITSITVTPTFTDSTSTITVNGTTVTSGTASAPIALAAGPNTITTMVTAQDGVTTDTYTIIVIRAPGSVATLTNLTVSQGTLSPAFVTTTVAYADSVENYVTTITVTPTLTDSTATITVNGTAVSSGTASQPIALQPGSNTITVVITAQDGITTDTYTITVFRGNTMSNLDATNVLTPNGDGKNDLWVIKNIDLYPQNNVTVFDKAGRIVYTKRGYNNEWDGTLNGSPLVQGTYYYVVNLGPNLPSFKGFISIVRN
jgi:gliding motility-associated-like protein